MSSEALCLPVKVLDCATSRRGGGTQGLSTERVFMCGSCPCPHQSQVFLRLLSPTLHFCALDGPG